MSDDMKGRGSDYGPTASGPIKGWRPTKVVPNGEPGAYELHWGVIEKGVVGLLFTLVGAAVIGGIAMYRQVGELAVEVKATRAEAKSANDKAVELGIEVKRELKDHLDYSRDIVPTFLTRDEYVKDHQGRTHR